VRALLHRTLSEECDKHVQRYFGYLRELNDYAERRSKREGAPFKKIILPRKWWNLAPQFNPFKVRVAKQLNTYAHTLAEKLRRDEYKPKAALVRRIRKSDGTLRELNIFQLPDAALSRLVYKSLLRKNLPRFSGYAFAYREDRTPHDAVNEIFSEWKSLDRVYVAEYDFSKFFDKINHAFLWRILSEHNFIVSREEENAIRAFLNSTACEQNGYPSNPKQRTCGIPQGTSISLFLANVACWELDRGLERLGVGFCRYADDTVIWSADYDRVVKAYYVINECSKRMGVPINLLKSQGIRLISRAPMRAEIESKLSVDYLGYGVSLSHIFISKKRVFKIKSRISYLIYQNLLQPLKVKGIFNAARLTPSLDLDYVTALRQIRYYLYGGLTDEKLRKYIAGKIPDLRFRGVMSYYPIVTDISQLAKLDGWLAYTLRQSLKLREQLWLGHGLGPLPGPTAGWIDNLEEQTVGIAPDGKSVDLRLPRFTLVHSAMRLAIIKKGIEAVANPLSNSYYE
jgi:RNA-directed DNA polymerase